MIDVATRMMDLVDRGVDGYEVTADNDPRFRVEVSGDNGENHAVICFVEPLRFHAELAQADEERFSHAATQTWHKWSELTDDDGYLTAESTEKITTELAAVITGENGGKIVDFDVSHADYLEFEDEPTLGIEVGTTFGADETFESWFDRIGWPVIATIINATDPGTFNFPYLFSAILYR